MRGDWLFGAGAGYRRQHRAYDVALAQKGIVSNGRSVFSHFLEAFSVDNGWARFVVFLF